MRESGEELREKQQLRGAPLSLGGTLTSHCLTRGEKLSNLDTDSQNGEKPHLNGTAEERQNLVLSL